MGVCFRGAPKSVNYAAWKSECAIGCAKILGKAPHIIGLWVPQKVLLKAHLHCRVHADAPNQ